MTNLPDAIHTAGNNRPTIGILYGAYGGHHGEVSPISDKPMRRYGGGFDVGTIADVEFELEFEDTQVAHTQDDIPTRIQNPM